MRNDTSALHVERAARKLQSTVLRRETEMLDVLEASWDLIAHVDGGHWGRQSPQWRVAAQRVRDHYRDLLKYLGTEFAAQ